MDLLLYLWLQGLNAREAKPWRNWINLIVSVWKTGLPESVVLVPYQLKEMMAYWLSCAFIASYRISFTKYLVSKNFAIYSVYEWKVSFNGAKKLRKNKTSVSSRNMQDMAGLLTIIPTMNCKPAVSTNFFASLPTSSFILLFYSSFSKLISVVSLS